MKKFLKIMIDILLDGVLNKSKIYCQITQFHLVVLYTYGKIVNLVYISTFRFSFKNRWDL